MSTRFIGRMVWVASLLASVAMVGMPALAQDAGEKRFRLSAPEPQQAETESAAPSQPAEAGSSGDIPAQGQASPEPTVSRQPSAAAEPPSEPLPSAQPAQGQAAETGAPAAAPDQPLAQESAAAPESEDDLPPPMEADREAGRPSATARGAQSAQGQRLAGKPLEIVPIREGKLSNLSAQDQSAKPAKSGKTAAVAKPASAGSAEQPGKPRTARPFWLDPKRHAADLSFKQGAVAFILDTDIGRRGTYKTFLLDKPTRRVVDIPGRWRYDGPTNHPVRFDGVRSIRVGEHPDFLRIVFDYAKGEARPPVIHTTSDGVAVIYFWGE